MLSQVHADPIGDLENLYLKASNSLLFFTSEDIISSGRYQFENSNETLDTTFFPLIYQFDSDSDFYNYYINGSIGYSKYKDKYLMLRGSFDEIKIKTYALKIGGGVRMNILEDTDMMVGASYIYSKVHGDYNTAKFLNPSDPVDRALNYVFNSDNNYNTFEVDTSLGYQPTINEYEPYIRADIRYFNTQVDDKYATISNVDAIISKLKVGFITPQVTDIYGLPLKLEFYASEVFIGGDMDDALGTDNFYVLGSTFHLGTSSMVDWVSDVSFDINIVRGDNLDGFNFGFGLSFSQIK
jgi:hypothetical protein